MYREKVRLVEGSDWLFIWVWEIGGWVKGVFLVFGVSDREDDELLSFIFFMS